MANAQHGTRTPSHILDAHIRLVQIGRGSVHPGVLRNVAHQAQHIEGEFEEVEGDQEFGTTEHRGREWARHYRGRPPVRDVVTEGGGIIQQ